MFCPAHLSLDRERNRRAYRRGVQRVEGRRVVRRVCKACGGLGHYQKACEFAEGEDE